jgi:hypothetical protein
MKFYVDMNEVYPVYSLSEPLEGDDWGTIDVSPEFIERYKKAKAEYRELQFIIQEAFEKAWI